MMKVFGSHRNHAAVTSSTAIERAQWLSVRPGSTVQASRSVEHLFALDGARAKATLIGDCKLAPPPGTCLPGLLLVCC